MPQTSPRVLIVRLDAIGDALALTPLLQALRERAIPVDLLLSSRSAEAFSRSAARAIYTDPSALVRGAYTHALVATEDASGYRIAKAVGAGVRVGFANGWGKPFKTLWVHSLLTNPIYRSAGLDRRAPHECAVLFQLGAALLGDAQPTRDAALLRPLVLDGDVARTADVVFQVTDKWQRSGMSLDDVVVAARAARVTRAVASASEEAYSAAFERASGLPVERFADVPSWKYAIASATLLVAPDSGAAHVAGMTGTPAVVVFPTMRNLERQLARWAPWAAPYRTIEASAGWPERVAPAVTALRSRGADTT
jgi:hypothetical protein